MKISIHINFCGQCEEAFQFYAKYLNASMGHVFRYADSPMAKDVSADWQNKILHANLSLGNVNITGADIVTAQYKMPQGFSLQLTLESEDQLKSTFKILEAGGTVTMPLQKTFWSSCYGIVIDKFGVPWELNCGG